MLIESCLQPELVESIVGLLFVTNDCMSKEKLNNFLNLRFVITNRSTSHFVKIGRDEKTVEIVLQLTLRLNQLSCAILPSLGLTDYRSSFISWFYIPAFSARMISRGASD